MTSGDVARPDSRYNLAMSHSLDEVLQLAFELPEDDRRRLANSLMESVEPESQISELWKEEAERRIDELEAGTATTYSWEEVKSRLDARHSR